MQIKKKLTDILLVVCCLFLLALLYINYCQNKEQTMLYQKYILQKANNETFHKVLSRNQKAIAFSL